MTDKSNKIITWEAYGHTHMCTHIKIHRHKTVYEHAKAY